MREIRPSGSEGGGNGTTRSSLPLSIWCPFRAQNLAPRRWPVRTLSSFGIRAYFGAHGGLGGGGSGIYEHGHLSARSRTVMLSF